MWCWVISPFYVLCGFRSVAVNIMDISHISCSYCQVKKIVAEYEFHVYNACGTAQRHKPAAKRVQFIWCSHSSQQTVSMYYYFAAVSGGMQSVCVSVADIVVQRHRRLMLKLHRYDLLWNCCTTCRPTQSTANPQHLDSVNRYLHQTYWALNDNDYDDVAWRSLKLVCYEHDVCMSVCNVGGLWSQIVQQTVEMGTWQDRPVSCLPACESRPGS